MPAPDDLAADLRAARKLNAKPAWSAKDLDALTPVALRLAAAWQAELDERFDPQGDASLLELFYRAVFDLLDGGRYAPALTLVDRLRELTPLQDAALAAMRGRMLAGLDRRDEAVGAVAAGLAEHPEDAFVRQEAAETYALLENWPACVEQCRWLLAEPPGEYDFDRVAEAYLDALEQLGKPVDAGAADLAARVEAWKTPAPRVRADGSRDWIPFLRRAARLPHAEAAAALHTLAAQRDEVIPDLLRLLAQAVADPLRYWDEPALAWAVMLLGDLKEPRGLAALRELLRLPDADLDAMFGDLPLELFPYAAASMAAGRWTELLAIAYGDDIDEYMATIPVTAVEVAVARSDLAIPQAMALLTPLYEELPEDDLVWFAAAEALVSLGSRAHYEALLADLPRLIETFEPYSRAELEERFQPDAKSAVAALRAENTYADVSCVDALVAWAGRSLRVEEGSLKSGATVGRNELCPCGSGRKFKKCCGAAAGS